jgi:hypothetical protein
MMGTELVPQTSIFNQLTRLLAREGIIKARNCAFVFQTTTESSQLPGIFVIQETIYNRFLSMITAHV